jgi:hypothetical protein
MIAAYVVSLLLIGLSGVLLDIHRRTWRAAQQDESMTHADRRFSLAQYRRRRLASGLIGAIGAAIGVWPLVRDNPWRIVIYGAALAVASLCITLLAAIDAWASRQNFIRLRNDQLAAQVKLARELRHDDRSL